MKKKSQTNKRRQAALKSHKQQAIPLALVGAGLILLSLVTVWMLAGADSPSNSAKGSGDASSPSAIPVAVEFIQSGFKLCQSGLSHRFGLTPYFHDIFLFSEIL